MPSVLRPAFAVAACLALTALAPAASATSVTATSSTGNVDTWGIPTVPDIECNLKTLVRCLDIQCPMYLYNGFVTLHLVNPHPVDAVSIEVVAKPGTGIFESSWGSEGLPSNLYPVGVATYNQPTVTVPVQYGGCDPRPTVVVTGILVEGEVTYELDF